MQEVQPEYIDITTDSAQQNPQEMLVKAAKLGKPGMNAITNILKFYASLDIHL